MALKLLIKHKQKDLFTEWDTIMDILMNASSLQEKFKDKKEAENIQDIFKIVRDMLIMGQYPGSEDKALQVYNVYKVGKTILDKTLSCYYINYMLNNDFLNSFQPMIEAYLLG